MGSRSADHAIVSHDRVVAQDGGDFAPQLFAREVFVRADRDDRGPVDLLLAVAIDREPSTRDDRPRPELAVFGPEAMRARTTAGPTGLLVSELHIAEAAPRIGVVSVAVVRVPRDGRAREIALSIEEVGRLLDYRTDPEGSDAAAYTVVRRLEVLTSATHVDVSVAGSVVRPGEGASRDALYLLTPTPLSLDDVLKLARRPVDGRRW